MMPLRPQSFRRFPGASHLVASLFPVATSFVHGHDRAGEVLDVHIGGRRLAVGSKTLGPMIQPRRPRAGAPNVVMIVLDDLGFADLGCFGSEIATPTVDGLAKRGLRYNTFHVTALCSPTRACLMTGRNHHAVAMGFFPAYPLPFPGYTGRIPPSAGSLPRLLRDAGYSTFAVGKWHLTPRDAQGPAGPFDRWPLGLGFERFYGFLEGMTNQWAPDLARDNGFIDPPLGPDEGYHLTEDLTTQAIRFVQDQQQNAPGRPFFLYFATGAMHTPHQVPSEWIELYRDRFDQGWEASRRQRFLRQRELGVVPSNAALTRRPSWVQPWSRLSADERLVFARMMEVYAGFLTHTDAQIGRLIESLTRVGGFDNTLILVLSDNGASADGGPHGFLSLDALDVGSMRDRINEFGGLRSFNHYAWGWAWAGNTPFKLWKHYSWLGGVRVPLIIHWPAGIPTESEGRVRPQFCHAVDLMPTILEAAGVEAPALLDGVSQQPLDGVNLLATLADADSRSPRTTQYFETMGSRAIYHDGWKATTDHVPSIPAERELIDGSRDFDADRWSLFHLVSDFSEERDVAHTHPHRLRQMVELWWFEAGRNQVLPLIDSVEGHIASMKPPPLPLPLRNRYVCFQDSGHIVTPSPFTAGFHLTADVEVLEEQDTDGVIAAQARYSLQGGSFHGGWACYVLDGRLIVTFAVAGTAEKIVVAGAMAKGRHEVTVRYRPGLDETAGSVTVMVDGRRMAAGSVAGVTRAERLGLGEAKLVVGRDHGLPVCDDYRPPFPFKGRVHRVVFETPSSPTPRPRERIRTDLKRD